MDECNWTSCGALARLDLIAGSGPSAARVVGSFCVPHASMASLDFQEAGEPTWYDWHRERALAQPAATPARQRAAAVIPLFQLRRAAALSRSGQRRGRARSRC